MIPLLFPPIPLARHFTPGLKASYQVESTWEGDGSTASYRYGMVTTAEKYEKKEVPEVVKVFIRMTDLLMVRNGEKVPKIRLAGAFGVGMSATGGPAGLSLGGSTAVLGLPLVGFFVPPAVKSGEFNVPAMAIENGVDVRGTGKCVGVAGGIARFAFDLTGGPSGAAPADRPIKISAITEIRMKDGEVVGSQGRIVDAQGTMEYKIKASGH